MLIEQGNIPAHLEPQFTPKVVSLVPSLSWYIQDICESENLVGITKYCIPQEGKPITVNRIGGTKTPDLKKILDLRPTLILANKEENKKEDIEILAQKFPVYVSSIQNLGEMYQMMHEVGWLCGESINATNWVERIRQLEMGFTANVDKGISIRVCYLIWRKPYMTVGGDTFIHNILEMAGFQNAFHQLSRYPVVNLNQIFESKVQTLLLSSEPYPFTDKHRIEFSPLDSETVDGRMFSWYGSYMEKSFSYLKALNLKMTERYA